MPSLRMKLVRMAIVALLVSSTASSVLAQMEPGDWILVKTPKHGTTCPAPCWQDIVVQMPPGGAQTVVGTHLDSVPAQISEGPDGSVWVAHVPRRASSRVEALVDPTGAPIAEEQAIEAFNAYGDAQITAMVVAADGTMWIALKETATATVTSLYRRDPDSRVHLVLKNIAGPVVSLQMSSNQCDLMWLQGDRLVSYDSCFDLPPTNREMFDEPKTSMRLLPDGGMLVTGSGPVLHFNAAGEQIRSITIPNSTGRHSAIALTPDGSEFWVATTGGYAARYSMNRNQAIETILLVGTGVANLATFRGWSSALDGPVPPIELTLASVHGPSVELRWRDLARSETGYEIQTRIGAGPWTTVTVAEPGPYVKLTGLQPEADYLVRIRTLTPWGASAWTNPLSLRTGVDEAPRPPRRRGVQPPGF